MQAFPRLSGNVTGHAGGASDPISMRDAKAASRAPGGYPDIIFRRLSRLSYET